MPSQILSQSLKQTQTQKLSMKMYIPLLQCHTKDLYTHLKKITEGNPSVEIKENERSLVSLDNKKKSRFHTPNSGGSDLIQNIAEAEETLYEKLYSQITSSLFPTKESQEIAREIIENISEEGFYEGDSKIIAAMFNTSEKNVEGIRSRFSQLEPVGVGAVDFKESFICQLDELDVEEELYQFLKVLISDFENMKKYSKSPLFRKAKNVIKHFKNPPAIDYMEDSKVVIPEVLVFEEAGDIKLTLNSAVYPEIIIKEDEKFKNSQKQDAKHIFNLIELRKNTLMKIGEVLVTRQVAFFRGGALKPLNMQEVADDIGFNQSTISRAISGKYLASDRGVYPIKYFFASAVSENIASSSIKEFIAEIVALETPTRILGDDEIASLVSRKFGVKVVRRTIGKYRSELGIPNKRERKEIQNIKDA